MPLYLFEHTTSGEVHEVVYHMEEKKDYAGPNGKQVGQWRRVWTKPRMSVDTVVDPFSAKDFVKATNKNAIVGDLWDRSKELSLKRAEKEGGTDPVRSKFFANYAKAHHGAKHPEHRREEVVKTARKAGLKVDFGNDD